MFGDQSLGKIAITLLLFPPHTQTPLSLSSIFPHQLFCCFEIILGIAETKKKNLKTNPTPIYVCHYFHDSIHFLRHLFFFQDFQFLFIDSYGKKKQDCYNCRFQQGGGKHVGHFPSPLTLTRYQHLATGKVRKCCLLSFWIFFFLFFVFQLSQYITNCSLQFSWYSI